MKLKEGFKITKTFKNLDRDVVLYYNFIPQWNVVHGLVASVVLFFSRLCFVTTDGFYST